MAVRHVALFRFGDHVTGEQVQALADALDRLPDAVGVMIAYRHGRDLAINEGNYDYGVVGDFATPEDYVIYRDHPEHRAVVRDLVAPIVVERASVQIDMTD
jgi:hypothetical protein